MSIGNEKLPFQAVWIGDVINQYSAQSFQVHWLHLAKREWLMGRKSKLGFILKAKHLNNGNYVHK